MDQGQLNHDFDDGMLAFDNDTSMDHWFSEAGMGMPAVDAYEQPASIFSNQTSGAFTSRGFVTGLTPNTVVPGATWNSDQLNGFPFPSQDVSQLPRMQIDPNGVAFDAFLELPKTDETNPTGESKNETRNEGTTVSKDSEDAPAPKAKRGRKKGKRKQLSQEEQDVKRNKFLERNRQAATKCRMKKKQWTQSLDDRMRQLSLLNAQLQQQIDLALQEKGELEQLLGAHTQCNDGKIQSYYESQRLAMETRFLNPPHHAPTKSLSNVANPMVQLSNRELRAMKRQDSSMSYHSQPMSRQNSFTSAGNSIAMSRQGSSVSSESLVRDSGISNMGTPDKPKHESSPVSDEGFSTDGFNTSYMPNPRLKYAATGPSNLVDPQAYHAQ